MTTLQSIKKIITKRNKAYAQLDASSATECTKQLELLLPKITSDADRVLVLQWLNEKNEEQFNLMSTALQVYKNKMQHSKILISSQEYDLSQWCTITQYAKLLNIKSTQVVTNQIKRGKIPAQNILVIPELDLKLMKLPQ